MRHKDMTIQKYISHLIKTFNNQGHNNVPSECVQQACLDFNADNITQEVYMATVKEFRAMLKGAY